MDWSIFFLDILFLVIGFLAGVFCLLYILEREIDLIKLGKEFKKANTKKDNESSQ